MKGVVHTDRLLSKIEQKKLDISSKKIKYYNLEMLCRIISRLTSFNAECTECSECLSSLEKYIDGIKENADKQTDKLYQVFLNKMISHLQAKHKLVNDGYYMSIYMPLGLVFGPALSIIFENMNGIGIGIGLCIGVAIGASLDAKAKKEGRVI